MNRQKDIETIIFKNPQKGLLGLDVCKGEFYQYERIGDNTSKTVPNIEEDGRFSSSFMRLACQDPIRTL